MFECFPSSYSNLKKVPQRVLLHVGGMLDLTWSCLLIGIVMTGLWYRTVNVIVCSSKPRHGKLSMIDLAYYFRPHRLTRAASHPSRFAGARMIRFVASRSLFIAIMLLWHSACLVCWAVLYNLRWVFDHVTVLTFSGLLLPVPEMVHKFVHDAKLFPSCNPVNSFCTCVSWLPT